MNFLNVPAVIRKNDFAISNFLKEENKNEVIDEIFAGLSAPQKYVSSRFFYDCKGSLLFEKITRLPEYYPTRTEKSILARAGKELIDNHDQLDIIELGSGDCSKISIFLEHVDKTQLSRIRYIPVDVSEAAILKAADCLNIKFPGLKIHGLLADFMKHLSVLPNEGNRLICFFGSTFGNLTGKQGAAFLKDIRSIMKPGDRFLIGLDMVKDIAVIEAAYNDKQGITAEFNKNILSVLNSYAHTDFNIALFNHRAFFNRDKSRIEMHLVATADMVIQSDLFPGRVEISKDETIHTENSNKFTLGDIERFSDDMQLTIGKIYSDEKRWFSLVNFNLND